ncbi:MAG: hypothetical protein N2D54_11465, partial [Chloroflexota bacterium]
MNKKIGLIKTFVLICVMTLLLGASSASAGGVTEYLDQEFHNLWDSAIQLNSDAFGEYQEFSPIYGVLNSVELFLYKVGSPSISKNVGVFIYDETGSTLLATESIAVSGIVSNNWNKFTFTNPPNLDPMKKYRIYVFSDLVADGSNYIAWQLNTVALEYSCGALNCASNYPDKSFSFRTYGYTSPDLDQEQDGDGGAENSGYFFNSLYSESQQFRARFNNVTAVGVDIFKTGTPGGTVTVAITNKNGGSTLGYKIYNDDNVKDGWFMVYFDAPIMVTPGTIYRIELSASVVGPPEHFFAWWGNDEGTASYSCLPAVCQAVVNG